MRMTHLTIRPTSGGNACHCRRGQVPLDYDRTMTSSSYLRFPHVHGDLVTFVAEDDVWVAPLQGGRACLPHYGELVIEIELIKSHGSAPHKREHSRVSQSPVPTSKIKGSDASYISLGG